MGTSLLSATPRTKDVEHGRVRQIHTYFTFFQLSWTSPATDILLWSSSHCFFVFFFLPLDTNRLRGESSFRPEPLRKPPYEPSHIDIQFYYNPKMIKYSFYKVSTMFSHRNGTMERDFLPRAKKLKNRSPDEKSRCRTCTQACYSPFKQEGALYKKVFPGKIEAHLSVTVKVRGSNSKWRAI